MKLRSQYIIIHLLATNIIKSFTKNGALANIGTNTNMNEWVSTSTNYHSNGHF